MVALEWTQRSRACHSSRESPCAIPAVEIQIARLQFAVDVTESKRTAGLETAEYYRIQARVVLCVDRYEL